MGKTTITVYDTTKKRLDAAGQKGRTYDQIINDLIDKVTGKTTPTVPIATPKPATPTVTPAATPTVPAPATATPAPAKK
jgi:hypothetical protein